MPKIQTNIFLSLIILTALLPLKSAAAQPALAQRLAGRILLQVEARGQAWYVNPADGKKYLLASPKQAYELLKNLAAAKPAKIKGGQTFNLEVRPLNIIRYINPVDKKTYDIASAGDAFKLIKKVSLGISNANINKIPTGIYQPATAKPSANQPAADKAGEDIINKAATAIRAGDVKTVLTYFTPEIKKSVEYTMNFLNSEAKLTLSNILTGAKLTNSTDTEKIYANQVYFSLGGYKVPVNFHVKKQPDGKWQLTNL